MSNLILPADASDLMAEAKASHPDLKNFSQSSDCVKAVDHLGRFVHMSHHQLRARRAARLKASGK